MTEHALNHRFRKLRAQAVMIQEARQIGLDMKNMTTDESLLPTTQDRIDKRSRIFPPLHVFFAHYTDTHLSQEHDSLP
jgi:hypothetical protein